MVDKREIELAKAVAAAMGGEVEITPPPDAECEVKFLGHKILALDPATNQMLPLAGHFEHPLVRERYFFTFPAALWNSLYFAIGAESFEPGLASLEKALAEHCDTSGTAGFWKKEWIQYDLLRRPPPPPPLSSADARSVGCKSKSQLNQAVQIVESRVDHIRNTARGYAGWLLTNKQFLDEHDQLLKDWADMVQRWGMKHLGILLPTGMLQPDPTGDPKWLEYKLAFETFFTRWRLLGLAAPFLPVPLRPLMAGVFPASVIPQVNRGGGTFVLPDTFPIGTRDALRDMLVEGIQRPEESGHLTEWLECVSGDNPARKPLARFARLLELQHYWRILHHRHAGAINRKFHIVKNILGQFLGVSPDTIHRGLLFITERLGKGWIERGARSPFGPF